MGKPTAYDPGGYQGCLIGDGDGIYDPGSTNGRLLLGLKGQISELELHTIRARLTAGLLNKAARGDLALTLPVGLVRDPSGVVQKDPNREVQSRLELGVLHLPTGTLGQSGAAGVQCAAPDVAAARSLRRGGLAQTYRSRYPVHSQASGLCRGVYLWAHAHRPPRSWPAAHPPAEAASGAVENSREPSLSRLHQLGDLDQRIRAMLKENYAAYDRHHTRGVPRPGKALLHGLVYCGECGHKMVVQYKNATRYLCNYLRQQYGVPVCQYIPADPVDDVVVQAFFAALSPVELDLYQQAMAAEQQATQALAQARRQQLERFRYQAALAERQFHQVDPDNRLVAAELERRWEVALRELKQAEADDEKAQQAASPAPDLPADLKAAFTTLGQTLPEIWPTDVLSQTQKKALLRCLIDKVVIHRLQRDQVRLRIVWKGGDTTTVTLPIPVGSLAELSNAAALESHIVALARQGVDDITIAKQLTAAGFRSPMNPKEVLPNTVRCTRLKHRVLVKRSQSHPRQMAGFLTVAQIACALRVSRYWIYDRINNSTIIASREPTTGLYLFPGSTGYAIPV